MRRSTLVDSNLSFTDLRDVDANKDAAWGEIETALKALPKGIIREEAIKRVREARTQETTADRFNFDFAIAEWRSQPWKLRRITAAAGAFESNQEAEYHAALRPILRNLASKDKSGHAVFRLLTRIERITPEISAFDPKRFEPGAFDPTGFEFPAFDPTDIVVPDELKLSPDCPGIKNLPRNLQPETRAFIEKFVRR